MDESKTTLAMESKTEKRGENSKPQKDLCRESLKTWSDMWAFAKKNSLGFDLILLVGHGEEKIMCHKVVLMIHSPVFEAMINRWGINEKGETEDNIPVVRLVEDDVGAFKILLKFLYASEFKGNYSAIQLLKMMALAKKYLMPLPEREAKKLFSTKKELVNTRNSIALYEMSRILMQNELEKFFEEEISGRAFVIFNTNAVLQLSHENLIHFLKKDTLNANECTIFKGCVSWAEIQCEKQNIPKTGENFCKVLGEAVELIRFPVMHQEYLLLYVKKTGIVSDADLLDILYYKKRLQQDLSKEKPCEPIRTTFPYLTFPRNRAIALQRCKRKDGHSDTLDYSMETKISLDVDRDIKVVGLGFFGGAADCKFTVEVKIETQSSEPNVIATKLEHVEYKYDLNVKKAFAVYLLKPVLIKARLRYLIIFTIKGSKTYFAPPTDIQYKCNQTTNLGKVNFSFRGVSSNRTKFHMGQMPYIYYRLDDINNVNPNPDIVQELNI